MLKPSSKGLLIAIGGNEDKENELVVLKRVGQEIGKTDYKVAVITTASEEPEERGKDYTQVFKALGAAEIVILDVKERDQANDKDVIKKLEGADLIFLTGGDQLRLTTIIGGSKLFEAIQYQLENGVHIAGTSAGAAVLSDTMIYDGKSEEGLFKGKVYTTKGFGFVENIVFDTHFMDRGRLGRLMQISTINPVCIGIGIGEDSGVILNRDGVIEVIGTGQVVIVDASHIKHSNIMDIERGDSIAVENMCIHSLVSGYGYNVKTKEFLTPTTEEEDL